MIKNYKQIITIDPGKRGGKPCIRNMRITVYDILSWLASGMTFEEIIEDFPELTKEDIFASLQFASDREHQSYPFNRIERRWCISGLYFIILTFITSWFMLIFRKM